MINLLFADDSSLFLDGVMRLLEDVPDIHFKARASNGLEVLKKLKEDEFDVVLLDINMPRLDGEKCARRIRRQGFDVKILFLSEYGGKDLVDKFLKYNIDGYLKKDVDKEELINAIRSVNDGQIYISKSIQPEKFIKKIPPSRYDLKPCQIYGRQREVLNLVCKGLTTKDIAQRLNISEGTVRKHRERIMGKSGVDTLAQLGSWAEKNDLLDDD